MEWFGTKFLLYISPVFLCSTKSQRIKSKEARSNLQSFICSASFPKKPSAHTVQHSHGLDACDLPTTTQLVTATMVPVRAGGWVDEKCEWKSSKPWCNDMVLLHRNWYIREDPGSKKPSQHMWIFLSTLSPMADTRRRQSSFLQTAKAARCRQGHQLTLTKKS